MSLRLAVVGAGLIGTRRAAVAAELGSTVTTVVDVDAERRDQLASRHGARATGSWEEAVTAPDVDALVVCTSNKYLAPIAIGALEGGKHVLVEKPLGRNATEAAAVSKAAAGSDRVLKVGFTLRFHPAIRRARQLAATNAIGNLTHIRAIYGHGGRPGYDREWRGDPDLAGGGELLDQGVHLLDLVRWFLGELRVRSAVVWTAAWPIAPLEDNAFVLLEGDGTVASFHTSWTQWRNRFSFEVFGQDGFLRVEGLGGSYGEESLTIGRRRLEGGAPIEEVETFSYDNSWHDDWRNFLSAVTGERPEVDAPSGLAVMRLVDDVYTAARSGAPSLALQHGSSAE